MISHRHLPPRFQCKLTAELKRCFGIREIEGYLDTVRMPVPMIATLGLVAGMEQRPFRPRRRLPDKQVDEEAGDQRQPDQR